MSLEADKEAKAINDKHYPWTCEFACAERLLEKLTRKRTDTLRQSQFQPQHMKAASNQRRLGHTSDFHHRRGTVENRYPT